MEDNNNNILQPKLFRPPQAGEVITCQNRKYYLGTQIGEGYFGAVYSCVDEWGNELVAKVILPRDRTYEAVRQDWLIELENLVMLRHPNITFVYDAFECEDTFYLIIERCHSSLTNIINMPGLRGDVWILPVARCLLQAITFIHNNNYIHKDIHPGNVFSTYIKSELLPNNNQALVFKVGDLGISRLESDVNIFNTILAQWMMPPEFLNPNEFGTIGKQVDIYHAGLVLLSLLLGHVPTFTREEILAGRPGQLAESLTSSYKHAIAKALRRHTLYRTQSPMEFWQDLNSGQPTPLPPRPTK